MFLQSRITARLSFSALGSPDGAFVFQYSIKDPGLPKKDHRSLLKGRLKFNLEHGYAHSQQLSLGTTMFTPEMDVFAWPARFRTGFAKCFAKCSAAILVGVLRSLNYRPRPPHSFRLVPRRDLEHECLQDGDWPSLGSLTGRPEAFGQSRGG